MNDIDMALYMKQRGEKMNEQITSTLLSRELGYAMNKQWQAAMAVKNTRGQM